MTNFEQQLQDGLKRETTRLIPDDVTPPGLPHSSGRDTPAKGWFTQMRTPLLAAAAVVVLAAAVTVGVVIRDEGTTVAGPSGPEADGGQAAISPPQFTFPTASRIKDYGSFRELAQDSAHVVLATPTGDSYSEPLPKWAATPYQESEPLTYAAMTVDAVLSGSDIAADDQIDVKSLGEDTQGRMAFSVPGQYLLFLVPNTLDMAPDEPYFGTEHYVVTGLAAGLYYRGSPDELFVKTDLDSFQMPDTVDIHALDVMAGWDDLSYMDHVAAGNVPETLRPQHYPAGSIDSPIVGSAADPSTCNGAPTTAAAQRDDGAVSFGLTDTYFCVSISTGPDPSDQLSRHEMLIAPLPIHAVVRIGQGWESQVAGVVDGSITAVVAVRGADDTTNPDDPLPDNDLALTQLGDFYAFFTDDSVRELVGYDNGVEVVRWPVGLEFTEDATGGWADDLEMYDLRDDLLDLMPVPLVRWAEVSPNTIRVFFTQGSAACYGAAATVKEDAEQVRVGLEVGWKPEADACNAMAVGAAVDIVLSKPLGDRFVAPLDAT